MMKSWEEKGGKTAIAVDRALKQIIHVHCEEECCFGGEKLGGIDSSIGGWVYLVSRLL